MNRLTRRREDWRGALGALAFLAVALKVLIPPGMMPATSDAGRLAVPLVICTGHGPVTAHVSGPKATGQVFPTGSALRLRRTRSVAPAPELAAFASPLPAPAAPSSAIRPQRRATRELAAPPPPSQGPPSLRA